MKVKQTRESFVCAGLTPTALRYRNITGGVKVYSVCGEKVRQFTENKDYKVDGGSIVRLPSSEMPDFSKAPLYGIKKFDHEKFEKWGNAPYMLFADYEAEVPKNETTEEIAKVVAEENGNYGALGSFFASLTGETEMLVFGDSISTGCEATTRDRAYFSLLTGAVREKYGIGLHINNKSIGGETSRNAIKRYEQVLNESNAKIMILAYGMNDQNLFGDDRAVEPSEYYANIGTVAAKAEAKGMKVVLASPCEPHPEWIHTSGRTKEYVEVLRGISRERGYAYADVNAVWKSELKFKRADDLLNNGINHPTDYGHYIYYTALKQLL